MTETPSQRGVLGAAPSEAEEAPTGAFDPSNVQANRARDQGLGVGARELRRQRDPSRPAADDPERDDFTNRRTHDVDSAS